MRLMTRGLLLIAAATSVASCAAVWGFDDATLARDGGAPDARDASEPGMSDGTADAGMNEVGVSYDAHGPDAGPAETAPHTTPDAAVDHTEPAPTCSPPCGPGSSCERAVGDVTVCVSSTQPCTDSVDCLLPGCCVWLDQDSGVGRCQSPAMPSSAPGPSCLCTLKTSGMPTLNCKKCEAPTGEPGTSVRTCGAP
jgi:hypothetical protein